MNLRYNSEQIANLHRVWFGGTTEEQRAKLLVKILENPLCLSNSPAIFNSVISLILESTCQFNGFLRGYVNILL